MQFWTLVFAAAIVNALLTEIPKIGLGTYGINLSEKNATDAVAGAMQMGYRSFDGAAIYNNEKLIGAGYKEGFRRSGLPRDAVWITSKLWTENHGDKCERGLNKTLSDLGLEYLDLYLIHFPVGEGQKFDHVATWKCMQTLVRPTGPRARYIGISNFNVKQLDELLASNPRIRPAVHQFETHAYLQQRDWVARNQAENITVVGYAPLGNTSPYYRTPTYGRSAANAPPVLIENPVIAEIARARKCTGAQVVLVWNLMRGVTVIPKSNHLYRQKENLESLEKCKLEKEDIGKIEDVEKKWVRRFNNPCQYMGMPCFEGLQADPNARRTGT